MPDESNLNQVLASLSKEGEQKKANALRTMKQIVFAVYGKIIQDSPVLNGIYRGSHYLTIHEPSQKVVNTKGLNEDQLKSLGQAIRGKNEEESKKTNMVLQDGLGVFITNNLVYAIPLEVGTSKQAAKGIYLGAAQFAKGLIDKEL